MKLALSMIIPSPEQELLSEALSSLGEVCLIPPWNTESHTTQFDLAVCVGPIEFCPSAKKKVLFVFGQTVHHPILGWDAVVVTSVRAKRLALRRFGYGIPIRIIPPALTGLHLASRRLVSHKRHLLHASEGGIPLRSDVGVLNVWGDLGFDWQKPDQIGDPSQTPEQFSVLEFNSRVKAGAIGYYPPCMEDGYDIQVRRHLALGGKVVCQRDPEVLGDLADLCSDKYDRNEIHIQGKPISCAGDENEYKENVIEFLKRI